MRSILSIITLLALLLSACSGTDRNVLKKADDIIEENPDSALSLLHTIHRSRISSKDLPYYAMLITQAQVKTDITVDSDSLISIAYREYHDDWLGDKGIRSDFYLGEVFYNQERARDAMRHYLSAYEESKRLCNDYWRAKGAERIADLFFNAYNYPEAARYRKEAIEYFGKADRVTNQRYAVADLASDYINDSKYDEAILLLDSVYSKVARENTADSLLLEYIQRPRIDALVAMDRINELDSTDYRLLDKHINNSYNIETMILKSHILSNYDENIIFNNIDSVVLPGTSNEEHAQILFARYKIAKASGNTDLALALVDSLLYYQNTMAENIIKESVTAAERDFYSDMTVRNKRKADMYFICFITAFLAAFLIWRTYRLKNLANRAKIEAGVEAFIELKSHLDSVAREKSSLEEKIREKSCSIEKLTTGFSQSLIEYSKSIEALKKQIEVQTNDLRSKDIILETLFKEKWTTLNMLCNEYYEKGDLPNTRRYIIDSLEKELKKIGSKKGLAQIEAAVDDRFDGIIGLLKNQCPHLSEKDISMATLIIAGFTGKAISYLMGIKTGNYYVSKRRLIDRIAASDAPDKERFITKLT